MIESIDRAIRVLLALQGERRLGIADLAVRLELAPSTVHGTVKTLAAHNLVVQDAGSGRYQLGPAVLRLGNVYLDTLELRSRTMRCSEELARRTGMAVRTGVLAATTDDHPPRAAPGRHPADARDRHPGPRTRQRAGQGATRPSCPTRPSAYSPQRIAA